MMQGGPSEDAVAQPAPASGSELRRAPRFTLLVRAAKLIIDGREYLCVLRDASATGVKVRIFHPLPKYLHIALETGSGERYPMELMWLKDDHAGFRFFDEVDIQSLIEDRREQFPRRQIRLRLERPATIHSGSRSWPILVRDISQQGACIETPERLLLRQLVKIDIPGFPQIYAKVCWRQEPRHGLALETSFTMEELALNLMKMHEFPLVTPGPANPPSGSVSPVRAAY
ncbi:MAG: PilZ domain-containing protein [Sphingomonadales bacterium]|nr:PilZ domain-containing protein [Sphingomonadales bacterium]MDE2167969.1 PilZ domain-containing protein [Sphingomonadales bacterium]